MEKLIALGNSLLHGLQLRAVHYLPIIATVIVVLIAGMDVVGASAGVVVIAPSIPEAIVGFNDSVITVATTCSHVNALSHLWTCPKTRAKEVRWCHSDV